MEKWWFRCSHKGHICQALLNSHSKNLFFYSYRLSNPFHVFTVSTRLSHRKWSVRDWASMFRWSETSACFVRVFAREISFFLRSTMNVLFRKPGWGDIVAGLFFVVPVTMVSRPSEATELKLRYVLSTTIPSISLQIPLYSFTSIKWTCFTHSTLPSVSEMCTKAQPVTTATCKNVPASDANLG